MMTHKTQKDWNEAMWSNNKEHWLLKNVICY